MTGSHKTLLSYAVLSMMLSPALAASPGDHIRIGDSGVLTPSIDVSANYHSNIYLADGSADSPLTAAPAIQIQPRIKLSLPKPDYQIEWEFGYRLKKFIDLAPKDAYNVQNLDRFNEVDSTLDIVLLQRSIVGLKLSDQFSVSNYPADLQTSDVNANIIVTSNDLKGGVTFRPGSALDVDLLGQLGFDNYNVPGSLQENNSTFNYNNRMSYGPLLTANWRFLPKTTLITNNSVIWYRWKDNLIPAIGPDVEGADYGNYIGKPDGFAWRTSWGLKGQFTKKLAAQVELGYGQAYYDEESVVAQAGDLADNSAELDTSLEGETFARDLTSFGEGFLVNAQVGYAPVKNQTLTLGYRKDFQDATFTNYVTYNYGFLRYNGLYANRLGVGAEFGMRLDGFHGEVARNDLNMKLKAELGYKVTKFLNTRLGGGWTQRSCADAGCQDTFYATQYDDFWGEAGITFTY